MTSRPVHPATAAARAGSTGVGRSLALAATWLLGGTVVVLAVTGTALAGRVGGWAWAGVAVLPLLAVTWWFTRGLRARRGLRTAAVVVGAGLVAALVAGAAPGYDRLGQAADALPVPAESVLVRADAEGSVSCFQECPSLVRHFAVPDAGAAEEAMSDALTADGWVEDGGAWRRGSFQVTLRAEHDLPMADVLPPRAEQPSGWELLAVTVGSGR
jgi:hypothetical protein